ncbi:MAG: stage 0 sporulation protein, partial [Oscillospiraceae bacterium]
MTKVIGIRFKTGGKVYFFDPCSFDIKKDDYVIVDTARGLECGLCVQGVHEEENDKIVKPLKEVT